MTDVMSSEQRSALMSRIRGKNTTPEKVIRSMLWREGFRFRLHADELVSRPDIVLPKWRAVVLVHGCFWHAHQNCRLFRLPSTKVDFWERKLLSNRERDLRSAAELAQHSWRVAIVWECAIRNDLRGVRTELTRWIRSGTPAIELAGKDKRLVFGPLPALA